MNSESLSAGTTATRAGARRIPVLAVGWTLALVAGAYLRWSYPQLTEFGIDQQMAVHLGRTVRNGWEFPLAGIRSGVGALAGATEYYLMAVPAFFSDAPEFAAAFVGLLGLAAGLLFAATLHRHYGRGVAVATLALWMTGPWAVYYTRKIWTPDTFPFFSALVFMLLVEALVGRRRWALPSAAFFFALELQLHFASLMLVPAVALLLLVFLRRLRVLEVGLAIVAFAAGVTPYALHSLRTNFEDLRMVFDAAGVPPTYDLRSFEALQALVAGLDFPAAIGLTFPSSAGVGSLPLLGWALAAAFWAGVAISLVRVARARGRGALDPAAVVAAVALVWVLLPPLLNVRHSVPIYFRYELYLLPVAFYFPAVALAALGGGVARAMAASGEPAFRGLPLRAIAAAAAVGLFVVHGFAAVESTHRAILNPGPALTAGRMDVYSPPRISESREAVERLGRFVTAERETILIGEVARGPLEYLANNRYRLRFSDDARVLILPSRAATLAFLPEAAQVAELAAAFGAREVDEPRLLWPPGDRPARVFLFEPGATALPPKFTRVQARQILANGLELVAYAVENAGARGFDLTTVWRVAEERWAYKFWLYNSFVNVFRLDGKQVPAHGEVELSTSSNWRQDDLLVVPTRVSLGEEVGRGLYRLDLGVYVRFPARAPIPKEPASVDVASIGPVRLGARAPAPSQAPQLAVFGESLRLRGVTVTAAGEAGPVAVTSTWEAVNAPARDFTAFVHIYGQDGELVAQSDGWPGGPSFPTSAWETGETVVDARELPLPPGLGHGTYVVKVELYDAKTMERLPVLPEASDRALVVGEFRR